jgi:transposase
VSQPKPTEDRRWPPHDAAGRALRYARGSARSLLHHHKGHNSTRRRPQHLCLDKGFDHDEPRALAEAFGFTLHLRTRGEEASAKRHARARARRWVVERSHSWLPRFRSILILALHAP